MALIRLKPDIAEKVAGKMGITPQQLRDCINNGKVEGRKITDRIYMIDDSYLPTNGQKPPENLPDNTTTINMPSANVPASVSSEAQKEIQRIKDEIEIKKQDIELQNYQIKLDEVMSRRELPQTLEKKKTELAELEAQLKQRETAVTAKERELNERSLLIEQTEKETESECNSELMELKKKCETIQLAHDALIKEKQTLLQNLLAECQKQEWKLDGILDILSQAPEVLKPYYLICKKMINISETTATKHYYQSEREQNQQASDFYTRRSNYEFDLAEKLRKVLKWLGG